MKDSDKIRFEVEVEGTMPARMRFEVYAHTAQDALEVIFRNRYAARLLSDSPDRDLFRPQRGKAIDSKTGLIKATKTI